MKLACHSNMVAIAPASGVRDQDDEDFSSDGTCTSLFTYAVLPDLFILQGFPAHIRSDNVLYSEFIAKALKRRIALVGAKTVYIMPGNPW